VKTGSRKARKVLISISDASAETGLSRATIRTLVRNGVITKTVFPGQSKWWISLDEIWSAIQAHTVREEGW